MKRFVILTVGKTHSGKTTFAKALEKQLDNVVVIDQDNHAEFINAYYKALLPKTGTNTFKHTLTQTIIQYAIEKTDFHLILCNSNRSLNFRRKQIASFKEKGFCTLIVTFEIPDHILQDRVANSSRKQNIFRSASGFEEVLLRQQQESSDSNYRKPSKDEADYVFEITSSETHQDVIRKIIEIINPKAPTHKHS